MKGPIIFFSVLISSLFVFSNIGICAENKGEMLVKEVGAEAHLIPPDQIIQMRALMKKNGKSLEGLQAIRFKKDERGRTHISFYLYINGVRAADTGYQFEPDGTLSYIGISHKFNASIISKISTIPKISESEAISIGRSKIINSPFFSTTIKSKVMGSSFVATKEFWKDKNTILAWRVYPLENKFRYVIIDAQTGEIVFYDDGIVV